MYVRITIITISLNIHHYYNSLYPYLHVASAGASVEELYPSQGLQRPIHGYRMVGKFDRKLI